MATSRTFPPATEEELIAWLRRFFETGDISPESMDVREDRTTTDRIRVLLREPQLKARVAVLMPAFLKEWNEATSSETTERLCVAAGYAPHPDNFAPLLSMYERTRDDRETIMRSLGGYHDDPALGEICLCELRQNRSPAISMICMRALCRCWPDRAAKNFTDFLNFLKLDGVVEAKLISSMVRVVPPEQLEEFLRLVSLDARISDALKRYPLTRTNT